MIITELECKSKDHAGALYNALKDNLLSKHITPRLKYDQEWMVQITFDAGKEKAPPK